VAGCRLMAILSSQSLRFWRDAGSSAGLAHLYGGFGIEFWRGCYYQILRPCRHAPKFANGLCRDLDAGFHLDPHLIWYATQSNVECVNVLRFISHEGFLPVR